MPDTYLRYTVDTGITYAYDRGDQRPSYVSFRFPAAPGRDLPAGDLRRRIRVLAIDDQNGYPGPDFGYVSVAWL